MGKSKVKDKLSCSQLLTEKQFSQHNKAAFLWDVVDQDQ